MRQQGNRVHTGASRNYLLIAATALLLAGLAYAIVAFAAKPKYIPPAFDPTAKAGVPTPDKNLGYGELVTEIGFRFSLAGVMYQQADGTLLIYLTNAAENTCNLACEIKNDAGETLYKSGAIRPGEYMERLTPCIEIENVAVPITMWVYAFEPDTWYSAGEVQLTNILQPH